MKGNIASFGDKVPELSIETKADGTGEKITDFDIPVGSTKNLYLIKRDKQGNLREAVDIVWTLSNTEVGSITLAESKRQVIFNATKVGITNLKITNNDLNTKVTINVIDVNLPTLQFSLPTSSQLENSVSGSIGVTLSPAYTKTVSVIYAVTGGTATSTTDYTLPAGILTFAPGETSKTISYTLIDDAVFEGPETFTVDLSSPTNANLSLNYQHTVTILDDEVSGYVWTGLGGDNNWSTPGNWSGAAVPGASDVAQFSDACSGVNCNVTIDQAVNVAGLDLQSTYSGIITQGAFSVTVGASHFTLAGGTYTGSSSGIVVNGNLTQTGGIFNWAGVVAVAQDLNLTAGTFSVGTSELKFIGTGTSWMNKTGTLSLYRLTVEKDIDFGAVRTTATSVVVSELVEIKKGLLQWGSYSLSKDLIARSTVGSGSTAEIIMTGAGAKNITVEAGSAFEIGGSLIINTTGSVTFNGDMDISGQFTYTAGTIDVNNNLFRFGGYNNANIIPGSFPFYDVIFSKHNSHNITITGTMNVSNNLTFGHNGTNLVNGGAINVTGHLIGTNYSSGGSTVINLNGTGVQTISHLAGTIPGAEIIVNKASGRVQQASALSLATAGQDLNLQNGSIWDMNGYNLSVNDQLIGTTGGGGSIYRRCATTLAYPGGTAGTVNIHAGTYGSTISIANAADVTEGTNSVFAVSVSPTNCMATTFDFATSNGTAAAGVRYTASSGSSSVPANTASVNLSVATLDNSIHHITQNFNMTISNFGNIVSSGTVAATGNIIDNDPLVAPSGLALQSPSTSPGNDTTPTIRLSGVVSGDTINLYSDMTCTTLQATGVASGATIDLTPSVSLGADNTYNFYATATDTGSNVSSCSTATVAYVLDTAAPTAIISGQPTGTNNTTVLDITVAGADVTHYQYKVGLTASTICSSATGYSADVAVATHITNNISALADGAMTLCVIGKDAAGNYQALASATTATWTKNTLANFTWTGLALDNNWSTPGNWSGAAVPGASDVAQFSDACSGVNCNVTIDQTVSVAGIDMQSTYTGTVTQGAFEVTVGTSHFTLAGGTFTGSSSSLIINRSYIQSGGTFTSGAQTITIARDMSVTGGTTTLTSSTVNFGGALNSTISTAGVNFYNVTYSKGSNDIILNSDLIVQNNMILNISGGGWIYENSSTHRIRGNLTITATTEGFSGNYVLDGTGAQTLTGTANQSIIGLTINKASGTLTLAGVVELAEDLVYTAGTVNSGTSEVVFIGGDNSSITTVGGAFAFNKLTVYKSDGNRLSSSGVTITVNDTLELKRGYISGGPYHIKKDFIARTAVTDHANATILINGTGTQNITTEAGSFFSFGNSLTINADGTVNFIGDTSVAKDFTYTAGTINVNNNTFSFNGYADAAINAGSFPFYNLMFNKYIASHTTTITGSISVSNNLTINQSSVTTNPINGGTIYVAGNITGTRLSGGSTILNLNGTGTQSISQATGTFPGAAITVNKASGRVIQASALALSVAGQDLTLQSGSIWDMDGYNLAINDQLLGVGHIYKKCATTLTYPGGTSGTVNVHDGTYGSTISIANAADVTEGTNSVFAVSVSPTNCMATTFDFATSNGTAAAGVRYTASSGSSSVPANTASVNLSVATLDNSIHHITQNFNMTISNFGNIVSSGTVAATGNIIDNDPFVPPSGLALQSPSTSPGNDTTPTIRLSGVVSGDTINLYSDMTCTTLQATGVASGATIDLTPSVSLGVDDTYNFYATSTIGSSESNCSTATVAYILDTAAPSANFTGHPTGTNNTVNLNVTVGGAGVTHYQYKFVEFPYAIDCTSALGYSVDVPVATHILDNIASLADGGVRLCVIGRDAAGNYQSLTTPTSTTWTKDATPPAVPSGLALHTPATSPGVLTTPIITVSGVVSGDVITLYSDASCTTSRSVGTASAATINLTSSALTDNTYNFYATSTDTSGNTSACSTATVSYVLDTVAPTVVLTGAPSGTNYLTLAEVVVSGAGVTHYRYKLGETASTDCTSSSDYGTETPVATDITEDLSLLSDGSLTLCAVGRDAAGNYQTFASSTSAVWIKNTLIPVFIHRSIGPGNTLALQTGAGNNLTINAGVATFASAIANNVGIGDALQYDSDNNGSIDSVVFISERVDSTHYTVQTVLGEEPPNLVVADNDWSLFRAYTSLAEAQSGIENTGISLAVRDFDTRTTGRDLVLNNESWIFTQYADGVDSTFVTIENWTTSLTQFVAISCAGSEDAGVSQCHNGTWGTGAMRTRGIASTINNVHTWGLSIRSSADSTLISIDQASNAVGEISMTAHLLINEISNNSGLGVSGSSSLKNKKIYLNNTIAVAHESSGAGLLVSGSDSSVNWFVYSNTFVNNVGDSIIMGDSVAAFKNNIVIGGMSLLGGTVSSCLANASNATNLCAGSYNKINQNIIFKGAASFNYLLSALDESARDAGINLTEDLDYDFNNSIDENVWRETWDIGASETGDTIYRSVGPGATTALAVGTANDLTIIGGVAEFSVPLPDNIGVGDAIQYDSDNNGTIDKIVFITGRLDSTHYNVQSTLPYISVETLVTPPDNNWAIYRAYTSLSNLDDGIENTGIHNNVEGFDSHTHAAGKNLVSSDTQWNIALYADGVDNTGVELVNWVTDADHYVKVFSPVSSWHVGVSQRHNGIWGSGAQMSAMIENSIDHIHFDGLSINNSESDAAIWLNCTSATAGFVKISNSFLYNQFADTFGTIDSDVACDNKKIYVWNNIAIANVGRALFLSSNAEYFIYNNTFINRSASTSITFNTGTFNFNNNIVLGGILFWGGDTLDCINNSTDALEDWKICGQPGNRYAQTFTFRDDLEYMLEPTDTGAKDLGADLSTDPDLNFNYDIFGTIRTGTWDIGAHEL